MQLTQSTKQRAEINFSLKSLYNPNIAGLCFQSNVKTHRVLQEQKQIFIQNNSNSHLQITRKTFIFVKIRWIWMIRPNAKYTPSANAKQRETK